MSQHTHRHMATPKNFRRIYSHLIGTFIVASSMVFSSGCSRAPSYTQDIRPILNANCIECHQPGGIGYERSGLDMRTYDSLMKGTKYGPVIIPGDSYNSVLVELIEHRADPKINMPYHKISLSQPNIDTLKTWIDRGAMR
jgi:Planctomycete cytochrome C